jgi:hypothetical protein
MLPALGARLDHCIPSSSPPLPSYRSYHFSDADHARRRAGRNNRDDLAWVDPPIFGEAICRHIGIGNGGCRRIVTDLDIYAAANIGRDTYLPRLAQ